MDCSPTPQGAQVTGAIILCFALQIHVGGELSEQEVITARLSLAELQEFIEGNKERRRYLIEFKVRRHAATSCAGCVGCVYKCTFRSRVFNYMYGQSVRCSGH